MRNINSRKLHAGLVALAALSSVLVTGCSSEGIVDAPEKEGKVPLQLKATIGGTSRSFSSDLHDAGFEVGEEIFVKVMETPAMSSIGTAIYSVADAAGTLTPAADAKTFYLAADDPEHVVWGVYPSDVTVPSNMTQSSISFTVKSDQNTDGNYNASDLMTASSVVTYLNSSATLSFKHRLSKIIIKLSTSEDYEIRTACVRLLNIKPTAKISPALGSTIESEGEPTDISMKNGITAPVNDNATICAIIPPQTIEANTDFIEVVFPYQPVVFTGGSRSTAWTFEEGHAYTFNVNITDGSISVTSAKIMAWENGGSSTIIM